MDNTRPERAVFFAKFAYYISTIVFLFPWLLLLRWGWRHWSDMAFHIRAVWIGMASLYPIPWFHMTMDRKRIGPIVAGMSCYLVLQFGVLLIGFLGR